MRSPFIVIVTTILLLLAASAASAAAVPEYFNVPAGFSPGGGIAVGPDGAVWFSATPLVQSQQRPEAGLGRLVPAQASPGTSNGVATFLTPPMSGAGCCANSVRGVAVDSARNRVWFVQSNGIVGWADPAAVSPGTSAGMVATHLSRSIALLDVAVDPSSNVAWFTEYGYSNVMPYEGNRIASVDASLNVDELPNIAQGAVFDRTRLGVEPAGIALDASGRPWFSEEEVTFNGWRIATVSGGAYEEFEVKPCSGRSPCSGSNTGTGITDVAVAQDGSVWFTNQLRNEVGRFDYVTRTFTSYSLPAIDPGLNGGQARRITTAPDGSLWVAEYGGYSLNNANAIVKIVPTQPTPTATVYHLGAGRYPLGVAADAGGNVWFTAATDVAPTLVGRLAGVANSVGGGGGGGGRAGGGGGSVGGGSGSGVGRAISAVSVARAGPPQVTGTNIKIDQACVGPPADPCSLIFIISAHEFVRGFSNSRPQRASAAAAAVASGRRGRRRRVVRPLILGRKSLTLQGGERKRVTIGLNATGRQLLRRAGRLTVYFTVTQRGAPGQSPRRVKAVKVTFRAPSRRSAHGR